MLTAAYYDESAKPFCPIAFYSSVSGFFYSPTRESRKELISSKQSRYLLS